MTFLSADSTSSVLGSDDGLLHEDLSCYFRRNYKFVRPAGDPLFSFEHTSHAVTMGLYFRDQRHEHYKQVDTNSTTCSFIVMFINQHHTGRCTGRGGAHRGEYIGDDRLQAGRAQYSATVSTDASVLQGRFKALSKGRGCSTARGFPFRFQCMILTLFACT